jgi:hypothetical protein
MTDTHLGPSSVVRSRTSAAGRPIPHFIRARRPVSALRRARTRASIDRVQHAKDGPGGYRSAIETGKTSSVRYRGCPLERCQAVWKVRDADPLDEVPLERAPSK